MKKLTDFDDDELLVWMLKDALKEINDAYDYKRNSPYDYDEEIREDYKETAQILEEITGKVSGFETLDGLSDEDFGFVWDILESYLEVFVIDHRNAEKQKEDEEIFDRLYRFSEEMSDCLDFGEGEDDSDEADENQQENS